MKEVVKLTILYHGSKYTNIEKFKIIPRKKNTAEFGDGVYFTSNFEQAKKHSCRYSNVGAVYEIDIDLEKIKVKNVADDLFYYLIGLNLYNSKDLVSECLDELDDVDCVIGKIICQKNQSQINSTKFMEGDLSIEDYKTKIKTFDTNYNQYCFLSEKAIKQINSSIIKKYYTKKINNKVEIDNN